MLALLTMLVLRNVSTSRNCFFFVTRFCECVFCLKLMYMDMLASVSSNLSALFLFLFSSLHVFVLFLCLAFVLSLSFAFVFLAIQEAICPAFSGFSFLCVYPCLGPMSCLCFCICICLCSCCKFESIFKHLLEAICPVCFMFVFVYMCLSFSLFLPSSTSYSLALSLLVL